MTIQRMEKKDDEEFQQKLELYNKKIKDVDEEEYYKSYLERQKNPIDKRTAKYSIGQRALKQGYIYIPVVVAGTQMVVGSCRIRQDDSGAIEVSQMAVEEDFRGESLTYLLFWAAMRTAISYLKVNADTIVWLDADPQSKMPNHVLMGIYQKFGFEATGKGSIMKARFADVHDIGLSKVQKKIDRWV